jgi:hypothetical protein
VTTKAVADWLSSTVAADLSATVVKAFSAFDRPTIGANAYIEWVQLAPQEPTRIGQTVTRWAYQFRVWLVTANEIALWAIVDSVRTMIQTRTEATIGGARHRIAWTAASRAEPGDETTIDALRYAAVLTVTFTE